MHDASLERPYEGAKEMMAGGGCQVVDDLPAVL